MVPLLLPVQDQPHGPLPVTAEAVPRLQSPVLGTVPSAKPLAGPHEPFTAEEAARRGVLVETRGSPALETETWTSIVELPGTLLVVPATISEKKSRP